MFKMAKLQAGEVVYDLGCGDGRIPVQAAARWGCTGVGVDFDENLVKQARKRAVRFMEKICRYSSSITLIQ